MIKNRRKLLLLSPYIPMLTTIKSIISENGVNDIKTYELVFNNKEDEEKFDYIPGQFAEVSLIGKGECPIGIASSPTEKGSIKFTIKKMGTVKISNLCFSCSSNLSEIFSIMDGKTNESVNSPLLKTEGLTMRG